MRNRASRQAFAKSLPKKPSQSAFAKASAKASPKLKPRVAKVIEFLRLQSKTGVICPNSNLVSSGRFTGRRKFDYATQRAANP
jgi:hypothetical protein